MKENEEVIFDHTMQVDTTQSNAIKPSAVYDRSQTDELAEYDSSQNFDKGLRSDLRSLSNQAIKYNQAMTRILAMIEADFTDRSEDIRGYNWLKHVLKFNEIKASEWNDIIESKENFLKSHGGLDDLEDRVHSDWDELSVCSEMWEFDKNVDLSHRSHFADLIMDRPDSESATEFTQRYEAEWDVESWEIEPHHHQKHDVEVLDGNFEQHHHGDIKSPEEILNEPTRIQDQNVQN